MRKFTANIKDGKKSVWRIFLSLVFVISLFATPVNSFAQTLSNTNESAGAIVSSGEGSSVEAPEQGSGVNDDFSDASPSGGSGSSETAPAEDSVSGSGPSQNGTPAEASETDGDDTNETPANTTTSNESENTETLDKLDKEDAQQPGLMAAMSESLPESTPDPVDWTETSAVDKIALDQTYAKKILVFDGSGNKATGAPWNADTAGLRNALGYIKDNGNGGTWLLYIGSDVTDNEAATTTGSSAALFSQATAKIDTLVITGNAADPINDDAVTSAPTTDSRLLTVNVPLDIQSNLILRNLRYNLGGSGTIADGAAYGVYMNGHNLTLGGGSWHTELTCFFGGAKNGSLSASPNMTVYSTGTGNINLVGGNRSGELSGNVTLTVNNTSGNRINIYGAGYGADSSHKATLNGSATSVVTGMDTNNGGLGTFYGGGYYCNVTGKITNTIKGNGRFVTDSSTATYGNSAIVFGGSYTGDIGLTAAAPIADQESSRLAMFMDGGASANDYIIKTVVETYTWNYGRAHFSGGNVEAGTIKGNIINDVKVGVNGKGSFAGFNGVSDWNASVDVDLDSTFTQNGTMSTTSTTAYKIENAEEAAAKAKANHTFQMYGNVTSLIRSGCVTNSTNAGYLKGFGGGGYFEGSAYTALGTEGLVWKGSFDATAWPGTDADGKAIPGYLGGGDVVKGYSNVGNTRSKGSEFDIFGGGGRDSDDSILINGNTTVVQKEVFARWTYGGNFFGDIIGNTRNELWRGMADTVEGSGYQGTWHVGNSEARVYGGEINYFLSGGGWSDAYQSGNAKITVYDGERTLKNGTVVKDTTDFDKDGDKTESVPAVIVNSSMGGTYGDASPHYIGGDSSVTVYGGDFSGTAGSGASRGFSAGSSGGGGRIYGNTSMTLDFRGNNGGFAIEKGDHVSAGRGYDGSASNGVIGTDGTQTATLNVFSDADSKANLNGTDLYGDAPSDGASSRIGRIVMNINAPGAHIGNVFATRYTNIENGKLRRDVDVNLVSAGSITGLSATSPTDNITNNVASVSAAAGRFAEIRVGAQVKPAGWNENTQGEWPLSDLETGKTADGYPHKIKVVKPTVAGQTAYGIRNFTSMNIDKRLLIAESGNILNGGGAKDINHYNAYQNFGDITISNESGLGVQEANAEFIAGKLTVAGRGYVMSPGAKNQITFTDIDFQGAKSEVIWLKTETETPTEPETNLSTNYFGVAEGWPVITINPAQANAEKMTPANFYGVDLATGKTYIGDSDTHLSAAQSETTVASGYAIAIPGSRYEWQVLSGEGAISYHIDGNISLGTAKPANGTYLNAYGTTPMDTPTTGGAVAIPSGSVDTDNGPVKSLPLFTFTPAAAIGEWVKTLDVWRSDMPSTMEGATRYFYEIEQTSESYQDEENRIRTWDANADQTANKEFGFDISVSYTNDVELNAESVILTEDEAAELFGAEISAEEATANVIEVTGAAGRPFFTNNIGADTLGRLAEPLGEDAFHEISVVYDAGTGAPNMIAKIVTITIVPNDTIFSQDKKAALVAHDATISVAAARDITAQSGAVQTEQNLDHFTNAIVINAANGAKFAPSLSNNADQDTEDVIAAVNTSAAGAEHKLVYSYTYGDEKITKNVELAIVGGRISGIAFLEEFEGRDGVYQPENETPISGVKVTLLGADGNPVWGVIPVFTDADGKYAFTNLDEGTYSVHFGRPDHLYIYTTLRTGTASGIVIGFDDAADSQKLQDSGYYQTAPIDSGVKDMTDPAITLTVLALVLALALFAAIWIGKKKVKAHG